MFNLKSHIIYASAGLAMLAGCSSFGPDPIACNDLVTAPESGARIDLAAALANGVEGVTVRLNGVNAACYPDDGNTDMVLSIGMKASRVGVSADAPLIFEVPVMLAILDGNDKVIGNESLSYQMAFQTGVSIFYPLGEVDISLPDEGRVVVSLAPNLVK